MMMAGLETFDVILRAFAQACSLNFKRYFFPLPELRKRGVKLPEIYFHCDPTPTLLFHKEPAQGSRATKCPTRI